MLYDHSVERILQTPFMYACNIFTALSTQVQAISDLSHEVTGVRMYSFYKEEDEKRRKARGPLSTAGSVLTMWQRCGKFGHGARRGYIRQAVAWPSLIMATRPLLAL